MKPSIPKGTRDFLPSDVIRRKYLFGVIEEVFTRYGYVQIETPTMENLDTLTGKYGEEGDKLLFKVLNNGDFLKKADEGALKNRDSFALTPSISKRGLRYDLTVPFARFVVMHQNELAFPFKRYQIQPVWRADRPQKGRYQEFYQCDVDVIGSDSLMYEAELIKIYDEVFSRLGLQVVIRYNHRKVLAGLAEYAGVADRFIDMTVAIDKLDKVGMDVVKQELQSRDFSGESIERIISMLSSDDEASHSREEVLSTASEIAKEGFSEIREMQEYLNRTTTDNKAIHDITLARGLSYYTGIVFEVNAEDADMGSLGGGGRYDDLTGIFGLKDMPGTGISFGAERIFDVMEEKGLFPESLTAGPHVLIVAFDKSAHQEGFRLLNILRKAGVSADLYPEPAKMKKQMKYADTIGVKYTVLIGSDELDNNYYTLKYMDGSKPNVRLGLEELVGELILNDEI